MELDAQLRQKYIDLFKSCQTTPSRAQDVARFNRRLMWGMDKYKEVQDATGVPAWFIGLLHGMEGDFDFTTHLHNGDPLSARTTHVPKGRPVTGGPPFRWSYSAKDALEYDHLDQNTDWSVPGTSFALEKFNGLGYHNHGIVSPYLYSYSNNYTKGKFTSDGHFDPNAVSGQVGAMTALKELVVAKAIALRGYPV